jgi:hypothetical protein
MVCFGKSWVRFALLPVLGAALTACGGSGDDDDAAKDTPQCPTSGTMTIDLTNVTPDYGSSVPNGAVAHSYQTVGLDAHFKDIELVTLANHTAGKIPAFVPTATPVARTGGAGFDYVYTFTLTWPTAGHVAVADPALYQSSGDGCVYTLPSPLFEYDITP